jgi:hypothetical protein
MSKSEGEEGIVGEEILGEKDLGKECPQSLLIKSSHIHVFFSHVKQRLLASNLHTQSCWLQFGYKYLLYTLSISMNCVAAATILVGMLFVAGVGVVFAVEGGILALGGVFWDEGLAVGLSVDLIEEGGADAGLVGERGAEIGLTGKGGAEVGLAGEGGAEVGLTGKEGAEVGLAEEEGAEVGLTGKEGAEVGLAGKEGAEVGLVGEEGAEVSLAGEEGVEVGLTGK